jgi:hypothetical protein
MTNSAGSLGPSTFGSPDQPTASTQASTWRWRLEDTDGKEVVGATGGDQTFPSQSDAESWVGEIWRDLVEDGVDAVTLFEGDRKVYGPMSLHTTT